MGDFIIKKEIAERKNQPDFFMIKSLISGKLMIPFNPDFQLLSKSAKTIQQRCLTKSRKVESSLPLAHHCILEYK